MPRDPVSIATSSLKMWPKRCARVTGRTRFGYVKRKKSSAIPISPGSKLGPAGKQRPPKVEKLQGDEVPPPEQRPGEKRSGGD